MNDVSPPYLLERSAIIWKTGSVLESMFPALRKGVYAKRGTEPKQRAYVR